MGEPVYGFGSPSKNGPSGPFYDWGFGSKTPAAGPVAKGIDYGFGDKSGAGTSALIVLPIVANNQFPDDGGVVIRLIASWGAIAGVGPYRVQLQESFGAALALWPKDEFGCWGCRYGKLYECAPSPDMTNLPFALPVVPPGVYDVVVSWGPNYGTKKVAAQALRVVWHGRSEQGWAIRQGFPPRLATGPKHPAAEALLGVP